MFKYIIVLWWTKFKNSFLRITYVHITHNLGYKYLQNVRKRKSKQTHKNSLYTAEIIILF